MECSDINPGAVQKGRTALSSPGRETRELSNVFFVYSLSCQRKLQTTQPLLGAIKQGEQ